MEMIHCPNCNKLTGFKRALGFGTFFMALITFGVWLLAIPFYPARCITCGLTRSTAFVANIRTNPRQALTVSSVIAGIVLVFLVVSWISGRSQEQEQPAQIIDSRAPAADAAIREPHRAATPTEQPAADPGNDIIDIDEAGLLSAYNEDEGAARTRYENRRIRITGTLTGVYTPSLKETLDMAAKGLTATAFVTMRMPYDSPEEIIVLPGIMAYSKQDSVFGAEDPTTVFNQLRVGNTVMIQCIVRGDNRALVQVANSQYAGNYSVHLQDCALDDSGAATARP